MTTKYPRLLREKLEAHFRALFAEKYVREGDIHSMAAVLAHVVERFAKEEGRSIGPLQRLVAGGVTLADRTNISLEVAIAGWLKEMPAIHRAAWLTNQLTASASLDWDDPEPAPTGAIILRARER